MSLRRTAPWTLFALLLALAPLRAQDNKELGRMWTFENAPIEYLQAVYGFSPDQPWLDATRLASLRFGGGCSSSFVSPRGLILTNHHCVRDYVARVSPAGQDWVKDGYFARSLAEEVKVPGLTVQQLVSMEDVTDRMNAGIGPDDGDETVDKKRQDNQKAIVDQAKKANPELTPQVVKLYQGAMFQLYQYRVFGDIRLCAAPNLQAAHFGGDPDNFTYPRFGIDFALCRAYEDGKPADTSKFYFKWSAAGPKENELVFVTGNPGTTDRIRTVAQLEFMRDFMLPIRLESIDRRIEILQEHAKKGPEQEKSTRTEILGLQNSQKAFRGQLGGLQDPKLMDTKRKAEATLRAKVDADPKLRTRFGDLWTKIEEVVKAKRELEPLNRFQTFQGWKLLQLGFSVVRATDPSASEQARNTNREQALRMDVAEEAYDRVSYVDHLNRARKWLKSNDPFLSAVLGGKPPEEALKTLSEKSKLSDRKYVKSLLDGGKEAVAASDDPVIGVARVLAPLMMANQAKRVKLEAEENVQSSRIGQALFSVYGKRISPDATFTLRLADGRVTGFPYNGTLAPWRTSFYGLYARNCEFANAYPFNLAPIWLERKDKVDLAKFVNFVCTNDIIGGNSGSPVINQNRELVGLVFDGNIESLPNRFLFTDDVARTVAVHTDAIIEALTKIYDANGLADELLGRGGY